MNSVSHDEIRAVAVQRRFTVLIVFLLFALPFQGMARENYLPYRMVEIYNPNPVAGRLYLQPLDPHAARSIPGIKLEIALEEAADYNVYFVEDAHDPRLTVNSRIVSFKASYGGRPGRFNLETGAVVRSHQDERRTFFADSIAHYHEYMGFGNIPEHDQYYGGIGDHQTRVIGDSGDIFLTTAQMYVKIQLFEDQGPSGLVPDGAIKASCRMPLSGHAFDTAGAALSMGLSKQVRRRFTCYGAGDIGYQDIDRQDFNAENLRVSQWIYDALVGLTWDMGQKESWYASTAFRVSSERVSYQRNPGSADNGYCIHVGMVYRTRVSAGKIMELFLNCNEDLPGLGHGLEPDFRVQVGLALYLDDE